MGEYNVLDRKERGKLPVEEKEFLTTILEKTMLISEKKKFYTGNVTEKNLENLKNWKAQKNLVDEKVLKLILEKEEMSEDEFAYAITPIHIPQKYDKPQWLQVLEDIMLEFEEDKIKSLEVVDISVVVFPFMSYVGSRLNEFDWGQSRIDLSEEAFQNILQSYMVQMIHFFEKCIVIELENYKHTYGFEKQDKGEQFQEFLRKQFSTKQQFYEFYKKYAVSSRLAAVRTVYFLNNMKEFFSNLMECADEISKEFQIQVGEIKNLGLSAGDSHEKGKEVIIVQFENSRVVYKPKNLDICQAFSRFIEFVNKDFDGLPLKTPKGVYKENCAFLEFIEYKTCTDTKEMERYYERFGYTLALGYFLAITDLHLENIIANGEYPVIVDGETMMQNSIRFYKKESVISRFYSKYFTETILSTALLPNTVKLDDNLELSALAGDEQTSHKKYLSVVNPETSDFHFEEQEYTMSSSNNIPMLNEKKVDFKKYCYFIISGFEKMMDYFYKNKQRLIQGENAPLAVFQNKKIRFLAKGTQKYGEMFEFLNHPSCCSEMLVRERILQNIWAYPHFNKDIIKSEYRDMLFNDIPIFYSSTSCRDLYDSYGNVFKNYFDETGYHKVVNRIQYFDKEQQKVQTDLLYMHLGVYDEYKPMEFARRKYTFSKGKVDAIAEAEKIAEKLMESAQEDDLGNINWNVIQITEQSATFGMAGLDLYEGISGIALFFLELYRVTQKSKYMEYYHKCMKCCEKDFDYSPNKYSAYCSKLSVLLPVLVEMKWKKSSSYEKLLHRAIKQLEEKNKEEIAASEGFQTDWIGCAGFLVLLLEIQDNAECLTEKEKMILEQFSKELYEIVIEKTENCSWEVGQAHGISGVMLALARYVEKDNKEHGEIVKKLILLYLKKEMEEYETHAQEEKDKWCRGLSGMILSRLEISRYISNEEITRQIKILTDKLLTCQQDLFVGDSLCHGNAGTIFVIKLLIEHEVEQKAQLELVLEKMLRQVKGESLYNGYRLVNTQTVEQPGLFTGSAGVGYMYLKVFDTSVYNVFSMLF